MRAVHFTLGQSLNAHRLVQAAWGRVGERTVHVLARGEVSRMDLGTLEELTGQPVSPADLPEAVTASSPDTEARAWLDGDASHLGEFGPYDWGDADPHALGEPVRVGPDGDLLIGGN